MGSRIVAAFVVLAGIGLLAWVALGASSSEPVATTTSTRDAALSSTAGSTADPTAAAEPGASNAAGQRSDSAASETAPDEGAPTAPPQMSTFPEAEPDLAAPENFGPRMDLVELDGWLNTDATSIDDFNGKVLLVEMWTFGCSNCKARIPYNQGYYQEFGDDNFEIIGVHAPEFSYEADVANIETALVDLGVTWPVALDTEKKNFRAWQPGTRSFWPRSYVIDQNGDIRYDHIGEGKYDELRETIRYLIENPPPPTSS